MDKYFCNIKYEHNLCTHSNSFCPQLRYQGLKRFKISNIKQTLIDPHQKTKQKDDTQIT